MSKEELFESAHFLLVGPAQDWFVAKWPILRNKNWDYFIQALRHQFLPSNIDHYIKVRSFSMFQAKTELFSNFLVRMEQFFLCRTTPMSEEDKFDIMWHTMRPIYRDRLALVDVKDLQTLEQLCTRIDNNNESIMNKFVLSFENQKINEINFNSNPGANLNFNARPESNNSNQTNQQRVQQHNQNNSRNNQSSSNPNFNHQNNRARNNSNYNTNQNIQQEYQPDCGWKELSLDDILRHYKVPDRRVCFNCRKFGHHFTKCFSRRNVFCCICGLPEFHYEECPFCEAKNQRRGD